MKTRPLAPLAPLALGAATLVLASGCSFSAGTSTSVDQDKVEQQISDTLEAQVGQKPDDISCPDDLEAEVDATMTCTLTAGTDQLDVAVKVTDVDGDDVKFDIQVAEMDGSMPSDEASPA